MAFWCRDCWEERLGFCQRPSPLFGWEVLEKSTRENHIKDQLKNEKHQNHHSQTPEEPSAVAGTSCILLPHSRDRRTQIQQTQWQTLNYINHLGLQTYVCGSDLTISRFFHLHVLTCCSSTFTVCTGRLGRLCLTNWLNLNLAAFREILSLSGVPMYMSSCCSWSLLPFPSYTSSITWPVIIWARHSSSARIWPANQTQHISNDLHFTICPRCRLGLLEIHV